MPVRIRRSTTAAAVPSSLQSGEIAINEADGKLYYRAAPSGTVTQLASGGGGGSTNASDLISGTLAPARLPGPNAYAANLLFG